MDYFAVLKISQHKLTGHRELFIPTRIFFSTPFYGLFRRLICEIGHEPVAQFNS
jgi:hypothetical protein